jgi:hypothetical protein
VQGPRILNALQQDDYFFSLLQAITKADGTHIHLWCSADALVLKALRVQLRDYR